MKPKERKAKMPTSPGHSKFWAAVLNADIVVRVFAKIGMLRDLALSA
jgi:hypothetical protein